MSICPEFKRFLAAHATARHFAEPLVIAHEDAAGSLHLAQVLATTRTDVERAVAQAACAHTGPCTCMVSVPFGGIYAGYRLSHLQGEPNVTAMLAKLERDLALPVRLGGRERAPTIEVDLFAFA